MKKYSCSIICLIILFLTSCVADNKQSTNQYPIATIKPTITMPSLEDRVKTSQVKLQTLAVEQEEYYESLPTPTKDNRPTSTQDTRSDFEKCVESGVGVRYVISGENVSAVSVTWENDTGGINQGDYMVPFCTTYKGFLSGDFLYISAQIIRPTTGAGSIIVEIYDGDRVISRAEASGFPNIATCSTSK